MGTRRPLIVQMVHDPSAVDPRCRLQDEDGDEFGLVLPETAIADVIRERTEIHLRKIGATVSSKHIVMRAEYAFCPNLTIVSRGCGLMLPPPLQLLLLAVHRCCCGLRRRHRCCCWRRALPAVRCASTMWLGLLQVDTPGFILKARKGDADRTPDDILAMVKAQCE